MSKYVPNRDNYDREKSLSYQWKGRIVFISNIPHQYKAQEIMVICRQFGRCFRVDEAKNELGKPKGIAFVEFEKHEGAQNCCEQLDGAILSGRNLRAELSEFPPPELIEIYKKTAKQRADIDSGK
ncbi:hypothetical protein TVAG_324910, partial [Trichomonas vaginalis G3]